jgi:predicted NBD/HSP70 family sugar kinase
VRSAARGQPWLELAHSLTSHCDTRDIDNRHLPPHPGVTAKGPRTDARARVVAILAQTGPISRAELARRSALAPSTVGAIVGELEAEGLVIEPAGVPDRPAVGRPPVLVALHRKAGVAVGIDAGKRHIRVALSDLSHTLLAERYERLDAELPAATAIPMIVRLAGETLAEAEVTDSELIGIGMGLPGPVHRSTGILGDSTILPGWAGIHAADAMTAALGHQVEVENDANLGALSEWMWGAGRGADSLAYLKISTGIGAGLILHGQPYVGAGGTAGEIGHTVVEPGGPICKCGNRGCLETLAGSDAIVTALRPTYGEQLTISEAISRALEGDAGCARAIADAGSAIGAAMATLCNLLNPGRVVVGGEVSAAGDILLAPLREALSRATIRSARDDVEVVESTLGERAQVLGAIALTLRQRV